MEEKPLNCPTPSSSSNGVEENPTESGITKNRTIAAVIFLFGANFLIWITASSSGPYFAIVATERKGQTIGQVGLGNGIPQLFMAIFAPLCGKYVGEKSL
jgi:Na+/melibiose symporter-like transporter